MIYVLIVLGCLVVVLPVARELAAVRRELAALRARQARLRRRRAGGRLLRAAHQVLADARAVYRGIVDGERESAEAMVRVLRETAPAAPPAKIIRFPFPAPALPPDVPPAEVAEDERRTFYADEADDAPAGRWALDLDASMVQQALAGLRTPGLATATEAAKALRLGRAARLETIDVVAAIVDLGARLGPGPHDRLEVSRRIACELVGVPHEEPAPCA